MNNQRLPCTERMALDGAGLKLIIGYGEQTMNEIVEAYIGYLRVG